MKNIPTNSSIQSSFIELVRKFCSKVFAEEDCHVQGLLAFTLPKERVVLVNVSQEIKNLQTPVSNFSDKIPIGSIAKIEPKTINQPIIIHPIPVLDSLTSLRLPSSSSSNISTKSNVVDSIQPSTNSVKNRRKGQPKRRKSNDSPVVFEVPSQVPLHNSYNAKRTKVEVDNNAIVSRESTSDSDGWDNIDLRKEVSIDEELYNKKITKTDSNSNLIAWPSPQIDESDGSSTLNDSNTESIFAPSPKMEPILNERGRVECQICQKELYDKSSLNHHMLIHKGIKPFKCPICHTTYRQKITMQRHMATHFNVDKKACELCGYKDKSQRKVFMHRVKEHGLPISANTFSDPMPADTAMTVRQTTYPVAMPEKLSLQIRYPDGRHDIDVTIPDYPGSEEMRNKFAEKESQADESDPEQMVIDLKNSDRTPPARVPIRMQTRSGEKKSSG